MKCQGNPISCYGKRSSIQPLAAEQSDEVDSSLSLDGEEQSAELLKQELKYEKLLETLIRNCKLGSQKSCDLMLDIMLMNSK